MEFRPPSWLHLICEIRKAVVPQGFFFCAAFDLYVSVRKVGEDNAFDTVEKSGVFSTIFQQSVCLFDKVLIAVSLKKRELCGILLGLIFLCRRGSFQQDNFRKFLVENYEKM